MSAPVSIHLLAASVLVSLAVCACSAPGTGPEGEKKGKPPGIRLPFDRVGYTHAAEGIEKVIALAAERERERLQAAAERLGLDGDTALAGGISPHDDHLYAQQVYIHLFPYIKARHVILVGVAHHAKDFPASEGKIVFDAHPAWTGPYGPVPVSPIREKLRRALPPGDVLVSDALHAGEHSVEGLIPFLQHFDRQVSIVPVLVPYMSCARIFDLARDLAQALHGLMEKEGLAWGEDVAVVISADCVHYGDEDWGGRSFADFGTDGKGYDQAVARDRSIIEACLTGPITREKIEGFYHRVVAEDFHEYKVTWCGRFSIPFGLALLLESARLAGTPPPRGDLLRYGTTLDPGRRDPGVPGLGVTAPANLHHWVGFCAVAYR